MENLLFHIISALFRVIGLIPQHAAAKLSRCLGGIWFVLDRRHRAVAINNLTYVFGCEKSPTEIRQMARRIFANLVRILFEIGWAYRCRPQEVVRYIRFDGLLHLHQAFRKGRGVLVLTGHFGNWELLADAAGVLGYPINVIYRPLDFKPLDRFFEHLRGRSGAQLFTKARAMRKVLRSLQNRELVGILLDQNAQRRAGVFVEFFGKTACTNKGLALIAQKTGAPVIPIFLVREADKYRMVIEPEVPLIKTGDKARDVAENTRQYNRVIESMIRRHPEQWFWVHRRWKTRPKNEAVVSPPHDDQRNNQWN